MKHFLITRFNLRTELWKTTKNGELVLTDEWLTDRFELFESYCLPSVKNQTNQNFVWCVFFDVNTPLKYKQRINALSEDYSNFRPIYIDGMAELRTSLIEYINKNISDNDDFIITTRLDNDDILHKHFIKTIQDLYKPIDNTVIDLREGYLVSLINKNSEIRDYKSHFNPFISLIENSKNIKTVISKMHRHWKNADSIIIYESSKLWIVLIHQKNMLNSMKKRFKRVYKLNSKDFGLSHEKAFVERPIIVFASNITNVRRLLASIYENIRTPS